MANGAAAKRGKLAGESRVRTLNRFGPEAFLAYGVLPQVQGGFSGDSDFLIPVRAPG